ncbi:MAG: DUF932 domain-containing protein [Prolixibacteraceae bacterium]
MDRKKIDYTSATHSLESALFKVERIPLFAKIKDSTNSLKEIGIPDFQALFNGSDKTLLSVVTNNYQLVTNEKALEIGKNVFCELFPMVKKSDLIPFKVISTKKKTSCHIDLIHKDVTLEKWEQDTWLPFLRISNSYNRTFALSFEIGFVRELCSNGFIFDKESIKVKFAHTRGQIPVKFEVDVSKLRKYEIEFVNHLNNLNRFYVDPIYVLPLVLKALNHRFRLNDNNPKIRDRELERFSDTKSLINELTDIYYKELKPTAYAVLNIVTDLISHQQDYKTIPLFSSHINSYYNKPGDWIQDFTLEIQSQKFNMEEYLGEFKTYLN